LELLHAPERRRHGHHEQAAITRRQRTLACPHSPGHRGDVVLELRRDRIGIGDLGVDVLVAEHRPPHRSRRAPLFGLFHCLLQSSGRQCNDALIVFTCASSCNASSPFSRPKPLPLKPPNGVSMVSGPPLTATCPASSCSATRSPRARSPLHT